MSKRHNKIDAQRFHKNLTMLRDLALDALDAHRKSGAPIHPSIWRIVRYLRRIHQEVTAFNDRKRNTGRSP